MQLSEFPKIIELELTNRCNKSCRICQRHWNKLENARSDLDIELIDKVLEQIDGRAVQINLGGLGESMLSEELPELLLRLKKANPNLKTGVNTNGVMLTKEKWNWLVDGRLDYFTISIDAPDKEEYEWLIGDDTFDLVSSNAIDFLKFKGIGKAPFTTVHCFELPKFQGKYEQFKSIWTKYADYVQIRSVGNWAGVVPIEEFGIKLSTDGICERPWVSLAIDTNGGFHRCCASFLLHNPSISIYETSIYDYWNGIQMQDLRNAMLKSDFKEDNFCSKCSAKSMRPNTMLERQHQELVKSSL